MYVTEAELMKHQVPLGWRDYCSHVLIPLNNCRRENLYAGWKCQNQKHAYEKCQYEDHLWRAKKQELLVQDKRTQKEGAAAAAGTALQK